MPVCCITVDPVYLSEGGVVFECEIRAIVQINAAQHRGISVVWTINLKATAECRRNVNFHILKCGPKV